VPNKADRPGVSFQSLTTKGNSSTPISLEPANGKKRINFADCGRGQSLTPNYGKEKKGKMFPIKSSLREGGAPIQDHFHQRVRGKRGKKHVSRLGGGGTASSRLQPAEEEKNHNFLGREKGKKKHNRPRKGCDQSGEKLIHQGTMEVAAEAKVGGHWGGKGGGGGSLTSSPGDLFSSRREEKTGLGFFPIKKKDSRGSGAEKKILGLGRGKHPPTRQACSENFQGAVGGRGENVTGRLEKNSDGKKEVPDGC